MSSETSDTSYTEEFCDYFACCKKAVCYCDKCNNKLCSLHESDNHDCSKYYCRINGCRNKATWTCGGCKQILCELHSKLSNHNCINCFYCGRKATSFCTGSKDCDHYVCSINGCFEHVEACPPFSTYKYKGSRSGYPTTPCPRCHGLRYFNEGRDACPNCQALDRVGAFFESSNAI